MSNVIYAATRFRAEVWYCTTDGVPLFRRGESIAHLPRENWDQYGPLWVWSPHQQIRPELAPRRIFRRGRQVAWVDEAGRYVGLGRTGRFVSRAAYAEDLEFLRATFGVA